MKHECDNETCKKHTCDTCKWGLADVDDMTEENIENCSECTVITSVWCHWEKAEALKR